MSEHSETANALQSMAQQLSTTAAVRPDPTELVLTNATAPSSRIRNFCGAIGLHVTSAAVVLEPLT